MSSGVQCVVKKKLLHSIPLLANIFLFRLFEKVCRGEYGAQQGPSMLEALGRQVEEYNTKCGEVCARMTTSSAGAPLIAICSPLMRRVHTTKHSGELCFIDSSGNMDREDCRVFLLLTHTCAGGIPLGIIITQAEDKGTIFEGLELLKELIGSEGFAGRGQAGPGVFLTDDSSAERGALKQAFPQATRLLCSFHLLQAAWRWLWSKESDVEKGDRQTLFAFIRDMLYSREVTDVDRLYRQARENPVAVRLVWRVSCHNSDIPLFRPPVHPTNLP